MMIRHCVFFRFRADVPETERAAIQADLAALRDHLSGMGPVLFSGNVSPEGLSQGYAHGFTIDFDSAAARDAYLVDPAHQKAGGRLVAALEGGVNGLIVVDLAL
jgi:hypothetical protein